MTEELPKGWVDASLAELVGADGLFVDGDWVESKDQDPEGDVRLVQLADVGDGYFRDRSSRSLTLEKARQLRCTLLAPGDVLVARMPEPLGRACIYPGSARPAATVVDVCVIRAGRSGVDQRWLMWSLNSPYVRAQIESYQAGSTRKRISRKNLALVRLQVPPLAEQRRIVAALEEQLSRLDAAGSCVNSSTERARALRHAVVNRAVTGRLSDYHGEASGEELLSSIKKSRARVSSGRRRTPVRVGADFPTPVPARWPVIALDELAASIEYGTSEKTGDRNSSSDVPVLRMGNIQDGSLDIRSLKYLPVESAGATKLLLDDGDLLFNRTNSAELVGKTAVYRSSLGPMTFASYLIRCQLLAGVIPEWVSLVINSTYGRQYIASVASQQVGQANVNGTKLAAMPIPLPPTEEQERILAAADELHSRAMHLSAALVTNRENGAKLRRALLHMASVGRLVPQDSNDEPASALLERIRGAQAPAAPKNRMAARAPRGVAAKSTPSHNNPVPTGIQEELPL